MIRLLLALCFTAICLAQPPSFEVAAIKPMKIGDTGTHWNSDGGRLTMKEHEREEHH